MVFDVASPFPSSAWSSSPLLQLQ